MGPLIADPRARKLSFTGSTEVGRTLVEQSAQRLLRVSMELGGNAPFLVFADADVPAAVEGALIAKMRNGGEACTAANRFYVHERVLDEFVSRLTARMAALKVGRGTEPGVDVGPLIDDGERAKVQALVDDAVGRGATAVTGGEAIDGPGWFYSPTVLAGLPEGARVLEEEIFGPVAPVRSFADDDEAIDAANATDYGLIAYAYTNDLRRALRLGDRLEVGMLGINRGIISDPAAPFGGVKQSGYGREGGREGIDEYLATRYISIAY
jgi:succinate-semialdehyde dehydrogenase/glutarate-semialdehyde dehydrogenase